MRFRRGNQERGDKFWKKEWERKYDKCYQEVKMVEHILGKCGEGREREWVEKGKDIKRNEKWC